MSSAPLARVRYAVRFGELSFGERLLEAFALMGDDAFGGMTPGSTRTALNSDVIEILDRFTGRVVQRRRGSVESIRRVHASVVHTLDTLDVAAFESCWELFTSSD